MIDSQRAVRLLVVDDSAVVRQMMATLFRAHGFEVRVAADPIVARQTMRLSRPDVMLLDLEMPRMHGLSFLRELMRDDPLPVVVCSAAVEEGSIEAIRALEEGAVDIIAKPRGGARDFLSLSAAHVIDTVVAASKIRQLRRRHPGPVAMPLPAPKACTAAANFVIAMGASTGGTEALRVILQQMPADCPAIVIVQHMPPGFTAAFAARLDQLCRIAVKEAADGDLLMRGRALIAPGNRHLTVVRSAAGYAVRVGDGPVVMHHRPSVDVLFQSVLSAAGGSAAGALLTGMGNDGAQGLLAMRQGGAATVVQDEDSSVVFGMPNAAIRCGAADRVLPLSEIAAHLLSLPGSSRVVPPIIRRRAPRP